MLREPGSPATWMAYAQSDLELAQLPPPHDIMLETLCFHAQQAVEKSIKAVLVSQGISFPKIHSIERLIDILPPDIPRTADLLASARLTVYATIFRYPGIEPPVPKEKYEEAVRLAKAVVQWAEEILHQAEAT